jgi:hypothetical protein
MQSYDAMSLSMYLRGRQKTVHPCRPLGSPGPRLLQPPWPGSQAQARASLPARAPSPVSPQDRAPVPATHPKARAPLPATPTSPPLTPLPSMVITIRSRAWGDCRMEGTEKTMTWQWLATRRKPEKEGEAYDWKYPKERHHRRQTSGCSMLVPPNRKRWPSNATGTESTKLTIATEPHC